jgi:hypothetical protein
VRCWTFLKGHDIAFVGLLQVSLPLAVPTTRGVSWLMRTNAACCTRLSSFAQWLGPEEGQQWRVELPEDLERRSIQKGLWGQNDTEPAAGQPPRGSGRHPAHQRRVPEEELPAHSTADHLNGLPIAVDRSSQLWDRSLQSIDVGPLCEGGWLAHPLPRWVFGMQCPSARKGTWGLREPAWTHMKG